MEKLNKTPIYNLYDSYGSKIIDFGGWALPVQFKGIIEEHNNVREKAGLFDVSHMGEINVNGVDAEKFLQHLCTNDIAVAEVGQAIYTFFCYEHGGVVDDLIVYKIADDSYMLVVNAANTDKDYEWILTQLQVGNWQVDVKNVSVETALLALQGPNAQKILQKLTEYDLSLIKRFRFIKDLSVAGFPALVSRTGYTGEDGFELYVDHDAARTLWSKILEIGAEDGAMPIGLGARDTLRLEANLPLYGHELSTDISPLEANLNFFVKLNKTDFIGKEALVNQKQAGVSRKLVGFKMLDRGIPRSDYPVYVNSTEIGKVTSGTFAPTLKENIGIALIDVEYSKVGTIIDVGIRNKKLKAEIIQMPFYKRK
jgi:aminomethyltransferase